MRSASLPGGGPTCASRVPSAYSLFAAEPRLPIRTCRPVMVKPSRAIRPTYSTSIARSATLIRSVRESSSSSSSTGTATCETITPVSTPSSTTNRVAPVTLTPYPRASRGPWMPGKDGSSALCVLTIRPPNSLEEVLADQLEEARQDDQVGPMFGDCGSQRAIPLLSGAELLEWEAERVHSGALRPLLGQRVRPIGTDGDHTGSVRRIEAWRRAGPGGWCLFRRPGPRVERAPEPSRWSRDSACGPRRT